MLKLLPFPLLFQSSCKCNYIAIVSKQDNITIGGFLKYKMAGSYSIILNVVEVNVNVVETQLSLRNISHEHSLSLQIWDRYSAAKLRNLSQDLESGLILSFRRENNFPYFWGFQVHSSYLGIVYDGLVTFVLHIKKLFFRQMETNILPHHASAPR